jgi:hypothetical protein
MVSEIKINHHFMSLEDLRLQGNSQSGKTIELQDLSHKETQESTQCSK